MAELTMRVPVGPVSCPFTDCEPTLDVEVTGRLVSPKDARSQGRREFVRLETSLGAFRNAVTQHMLDTHADGVVELSDGTERRVDELSHDDWDDLFSPTDGNKDEEEE